MLDRKRCYSGWNRKVDPEATMRWALEKPCLLLMRLPCAVSLGCWAKASEVWFLSVDVTLVVGRHRLLVLGKKRDVGESLPLPLVVLAKQRWWNQDYFLRRLSWREGMAYFHNPGR